jgi:hypothetical protein
MRWLRRQRPKSHTLPRRRENRFHFHYPADRPEIRRSSVSRENVEHLLNLTATHMLLVIILAGV